MKTGYSKRQMLISAVLALMMVILSWGQAYAVTRPTKISIGTKHRIIYVGGKTTVYVKSVSPKKAPRKVTYKSSNTRIATVSSKGVVTGKKPGKVTITVASKYRKKVKSRITITVKKRPAKPAPDPEPIPEPTPEPDPGDVLDPEPEAPEPTFDFVPHWDVPEGYPRYEVSTRISHSGMKYQAIDCATLHSDINSDSPLFVNLVDVRESVDYSIYHLKGSVSAPIPNHSTSLSIGKKNIANYVAELPENSIILIICNASEEYTDAATTLLLANGVPANNIVRIEGGLSTYSRLYPEDLSK